MTRLKQRDPSTLKVIRDVSTKKIMYMDTTIPSECEYCEPRQPAWVDITLSNFVNCPCTSLIRVWPYNEGSYKIEGVAEAINDKTFRIKHLSGCVYEAIFSGNFGTYFVWWPSTSCQGSPLGSTTFNRLKIRITARAGDAFVDFNHIIVYNTINESNWFPIFYGNVPYSEGDSCLDTENIGTNDFDACLSSVPAQYYLTTCGSTGQISLSIP